MSEFEIIYSAKNGFTKISLEEPPSSLEEDEVLIRPKAIGICGSDILSMRTYKGENLRLGHEWVGTVEAIGDKTKFKIDQKVSSTAMLGCGECKPCLEQKNNLCVNPTILGSDKLGMLRSWVVLKNHQITPMPDLSVEDCSLLEVLAVGDEAIRKLQSLTDEKQKLLIIGAGPVGVMTSFIAQKLDYDYEVVEVEKYRLNKAKEMNLNATALGMALLDDRFKCKFNMIIDCSGDNGGKPGGFKYIPYFASRGVKVVFVGKYSAPQQVNLEHFFSSTAQCLWMRGMSDKSYQETVKNWSSSVGEITSIAISHQFDSNQVQEAFDTANSQKESLKVLINI
jgi:threonine dehydrogenase-like Zn-dependent dehydrogenase